MFSVFEKEQGAKCSWHRMREEESDLKSEKGPYHVKSCSLKREFKFYSERDQKPMECFEQKRDHFLVCSSCCILHRGQGWENRVPVRSKENSGLE